MKCPNCKVECSMSGDLHKCIFCGFTSGGNYQKIDEVYAFVSVDGDGNEGIIAFQSPNGPMPLIAGNKARLEVMKPIAKKMMSGLDVGLKLLKFSSRVEMEI